MKNNYLIISLDKFNAQFNLDIILKSIKEDYDLIKYLYPDTSFAKLTEELDTFNLFTNKKVVILENFELVDEKDLSVLIKYLEKPSDNYLILVANSIKKNILSKIDKYLEIIEKYINSEDLIKKNLEHYKMDNDTIKYFAIHCLNNNEKILNELNKLKILKINDDEKIITKEDIIFNIVRDYEDDPFILPNAISKKDKFKAIEIFHRLSSKEKDSVKLLATISHQIRNLYIAKVLSSKMTPEEIADFTNQKLYPVKLAINNSENYTETELIDMLDALSDIDIISKSEYKDIDLLFELFILGL